MVLHQQHQGSLQGYAGQPGDRGHCFQPSYAWLRVHGKAVFENNMAVKEGAMGNPIVKGQYGEAANPIFEVFYIADPHGVIADFSGNPPYEF